MSIAFEQQLIGLLDDAGWVKSVRRGRQDIEVDWTPLGLERGKRWFEEVRALWPDPAPDEELLRSYGLHFGFVKTTRRDRTKQRVRQTLSQGPVLVVSTSPEGGRRFRLFEHPPCDALYDYVETEHDAGQEVMFVNPNHLLDHPRPWRGFPFSIPVTQERTAPGEAD